MLCQQTVSLIIFCYILLFFNERLFYIFIVLSLKHVFVYRICALLQPLGVFSIRCHPARDKVSQATMQAGPRRSALPHAQVL